MLDMIVNFGEFDFVGDDSVVLFQVEGFDVCGCVVQFGLMFDIIFVCYDYLVLVVCLFVEVVVLMVLFGILLKFEGKFIVQI